MDPLKVAKFAAIEAGKILLESWNSIKTSHVQNKQLFDYVTHVDIESEKKIIHLILQAFPEHQILAEESGTQYDVRIDSQSGSFRWIIDPLDGTTNYIHGLPICSISIALEHHGEIILGVVYDPFRDEMYSAKKSKGSYLNDSRIYVSKKRTLSHCLVATGFPFKRKDLLPRYCQALTDIFQHVSGIRRLGSAALDLCYVACGRYDGFWELLLKSWDIAAGSIIVKEAGGKITDIWGSTNYLNAENTIASNGYIQQEIIDIVSHIFPEPY